MTAPTEDGHSSAPTRKRCSKCGVTKALDQFSRDKSRKDGHHPWCKACNYIKNKKWQQSNAGKLAKYNRRWKHKHPVKVKARHQNWKRNNPEKYLLCVARARSKRKSFEFNLSASDISVPKLCPYLGIPISMDLNQDNLPSIDRIDNSIGYVSGNVEVISYRANNIKGYASLEELVKMGARARKMLK